MTFDDPFHIPPDPDKNKPAYSLTKCRSHLILAALFENKMLFAEALHEIQTLKKISKSTWYADFRIASLYYKMGQYTDALEICLSAISAAPVEEIALIRLAVKICFKTNETTKALSYLNTIEKVFPHDNEIKIYRGLCFFKLNRYQQALDELDSACAANELTEDVLLAMGTSYFALKKYDSAYLYLNQFFELTARSEITPDREEAFFKLLACIEKMPENLVSLQLCEKVLSLLNPGLKQKPLSENYF